MKMGDYLSNKNSLSVSFPSYPNFNISADNIPFRRRPKRKQPFRKALAEEHYF